MSFVCLFIYVSGKKNEINQLRFDIVADLKKMLDDHNVLAKSFRMAKDKIFDNGPLDVKLKLIGRRDGDARRYNLPSVCEVAALIVGDFDESLGNRDIIIETQSGELQHINELHPSYLPLQYPLLFPYGEDGYRDDISFSNLRNSSTNARKKVSIKYFAYHIHEREGESNIILSSRRLYQQFLVDAYTMVESSRLLYVRMHQQQLRSDMYKNLMDALLM